MSFEILRGDALDLIQQEQGLFDLIVTDPPYAFGGSGEEHAISATVAIVLREAAARLRKGRWMVVLCASSWRSMSYMVESVRGIVEPIRVGTWCKPESRCKVSTPGWSWASVSAIAFRKGKAEDLPFDGKLLDHVTASVVRNGERIYDDEIAPALRKIGERCKALCMPFVAQVEYAPGKCAHTVWSNAGACFDQLLTMAAARSEGNVDALMEMVVMKYTQEHGHRSVILKQLGVKVQPSDATGREG